MKKFLALLGLALASATPAHAGFGMTAYMGGTNDGAALGIQAPTLDYRASGVLVQVHLLDLIGELPNKYLDLGVDVSGIAMKRKVAADVEGVLMPGGSVTLHADTGFDSVGWQALAQLRMGAEMKQGMGFGMYIVPVIGASNLLTGKVGLAYGGTLQVSAWFKKK
ncbi:MAG: hypothetical protein Q8P41_24060 [Pseudomonadota bacterium]|nr:hypothetical protein [Pseudomonadota bacterium]